MERVKTIMAMSIEQGLARQVARVIEAHQLSISEALGKGLARWMDERGEPELAAMLADGRNMWPRQYLRHQ
jgi:hypothetical protein